LIADVFKLAWAGTRLTTSRLILAVVGSEEHAYLRRPEAWLSAALVESRIEIANVGHRRVPSSRAPSSFEKAASALASPQDQAVARRNPFGRELHRASLGPINAPGI
jgi:hypothetical protein